MKVTKLPLLEDKQVIKSIVDILDSYNQLYKELSGNQAKTYLDYFSKEHADEETLIRPTLFSDFLEKILCFSKNDFIPESTNIAGTTPDFIPLDTNLHPFVFDTKGTNAFDLRQHYAQIKGYIECNNLAYGILCNMRDIAVFTSKDEEPIQELSFSFYQLYRDYYKYKLTLDHILVKPNTRKCLKFIEHFRFQKIDKLKKIKLISEKKQWTGKEILNSELLVSKLRNVVSWLHEDVRKQKDFIPQLVESDNRKGKIVQEIDSILEDTGNRVQNITTRKLNDVVKDKDDFLLQAKDIYFYRTAYFAMTRILLVRAWEDIRFIDESLYNGGFKKWYAAFNSEIRKVLKYAFGLATEKYSWLYALENNYSWYEPSQDILIDVLYEFSQFNFSKLNTDVLGTVYEEYVDRTDRKNKGQYYTPREIISFIWDRVGFTSDEAFFRIEGNKRQPRLIFDPATGSGGFLVEAARRIREEAKYNDKDYRELLEIQNAITNGLFGSEISAFPYYITEINLLLQLTPNIKKLLDAHKHLYKPPPYCLSVIRQDSMKLQLEQRVLAMPETLKNVRYEHDEKYNQIALEGAKREKFNFIRDNSNFDYVCANPPYIAEKGHKELFRSTIQHYSYWQKYFQGKMDYFYWFVILGVSKLKEKGKLGFITPSYWPTADGAIKLRAYILGNTVIKEIVDFGETRIFESAPGQHNMVFILEKCADKNVRQDNKIKIVRVKKDFPVKTTKENLHKLTEHISRNINKEKFTDDYIEVFYSAKKQGGLTDAAWHLMHTRKSEILLEKIENIGVPLAEICNINQGYVSGCHKVTNENINLLSHDTIDKYHIKIGDGIFVLSESELAQLNLPAKEKEIIKPTYKNSDISGYITEDEKNEWLIYTTKDTKINDFPKIKEHLEKFHPILEQKRECQEGKLPWFSLHWPREQTIFEDEKIVSPYRAEVNSFSYNNGGFYGSTDMYFITKKSTTKESIKYILALLNSTLLDTYCSHQLKPKGKIREYFPTPLSKIPIYPIDFKNPKEVKIYNTLVRKVDEIIEHKKGLAKSNKYFIERLSRLASNEPLPEIDIQKYIDTLQDNKKLSLRLHPEIKITPELDLLKQFDEKEFYLARTKEEKDRIMLSAKNKTHLIISGEKHLLKLVTQLLGRYIGRRFIEIKNSILLPDNISLFNKKLEQMLNEVKTLRKSIENIQASIDNIVDGLYKVTNH